MMSAASLLLICRQSPWSGPAAREALDVALSGGAFDLPVSMLWLGDAVLQLRSGQHAQVLEQKDLQAQLMALPLFGIEQLYVAEQSLQERSLSTADLCIGVQELDTEQVRELVQQHQHILVF